MQVRGNARGRAAVSLSDPVGCAEKHRVSAAQLNRAPSSEEVSHVNGDVMAAMGVPLVHSSPAAGPSEVMPLSAPAAGGDMLTPLSALAIGGGGALMPTDGNQAAYMPPASLPSSTARAVEAEPDDDGVRTLQRLE